MNKYYLTIQNKTDLAEFLAKPARRKIGRPSREYQTESDPMEIALYHAPEEMTYKTKTKLIEKLKEEETLIPVDLAMEYGEPDWSEYMEMEGITTLDEALECIQEY